MKFPNLTNLQIRLLLLVWRDCRLTGRMTLKPKQREIAVPLWRRELLEIWWRQAADDRSRGPYFSLTAAGYQLACALLSAREERRQASQFVRVPPPAALQGIAA